MSKQKDINRTMAVPESALKPKDDEKPPEVEVQQTYASHGRPGANAAGLILNIDNYLAPEDRDPNKVYGWRTTDARRTGAWKSRGWKPVVNPKTGKPLPAVGDVILCERPKKMAEVEEAQIRSTLKTMRKRHSAQTVADSNPYLEGPVEVVERE